MDWRKSWTVLYPNNANQRFGICGCRLVSRRSCEVTKLNMKHLFTTCLNSIPANRLLIGVGLMLCMLYEVDAQTPYKTSYIISQDGTGDFKTIQEALNSAKAFPDIPIIIRIKPGT